MPWTCNICKTVYNEVRGDTPKLCYTTPQCKAKGAWACTWEEAAPAAAARTAAEVAAELGYPTYYNSSADSFPAKHSTKTMYINHSATRGISPDGSTHSGNREGWKGFTRSAKGWTYSGSYQMDLQPWAHRANDAKTAFSNGDA